LEEQQRNILIKQAIDKMNEADQAKKTSAEYKAWLKLYPQVIGQKQDSNASNKKVETKTYENKTNEKQTIKKSTKDYLNSDAILAIIGFLMGTGFMLFGSYAQTAQSYDFTLIGLVILSVSCVFLFSSLKQLRNM
jgi:hypothetical protein